MTPTERAALRAVITRVEADLVLLRRIVDEARPQLPECAYCHEPIGEDEIPTSISPPRVDGRPKSLLFHSPAITSCLRNAGSNAMRRGEDKYGEEL